MMDEYIDLKVFIEVLKKYIVLIAAVPVILGIAAFIYVQFYVSPVYTSSALIYIQNAQDDSDRLYLGDIEAAFQLVDTCKVIFTSKTAVSQVREEMETDIPESALSSMMSVSAVNETGLLMLSASTTNPELSYEMVNALTKVAQSEFNRVVKSGTIEVVDYAEIPVSPSSPNKLKIIVIAVFLGSVATYGIVLLKEILDRKIKSGDDLEKKIKIPVFTEIPDLNTKQLSIAGAYGSNRGNSVRRVITKDMITNDDTSFQIVEAYNVARTNIMFATLPFDKKIVIVSSANAGEGKSTTTANIGIVFARSGYRVLIIDCDLRKPTQHEFFKVNSKNGLSSLLCGLCSVDEAMKKNVSENLDLIPAGPIPPNPSELLNSLNMKQLLDRASEAYDYIFLDTPPINVFTDSQLLNNNAAGILLVVRENFTTYPDIEKAISRVKMADGNVLGLIKSDCKDVMKRLKGKKYSAYLYGETKKNKS